MGDIESNSTSCLQLDSNGCNNVYPVSAGGQEGDLLLLECKHHKHSHSCSLHSTQLASIAMHDCNISACYLLFWRTFSVVAWGSRSWMMPPMTARTNKMTIIHDITRLHQNQNSLDRIRETQSTRPILQMLRNHYQFITKVLSWNLPIWITQVLPIWWHLPNDVKLSNECIIIIMGTSQLAECKLYKEAAPKGYLNHGLATSKILCFVD